MADQSTIDPKSGFCSQTKTFHSLRPQVPLPPLSASISVADYAFSLLQSFPPPPTTAALIDAVTGRRISFEEFIRRTKTLSSSLHHRLGLRKGDTAFILSPNSVDIPILCFSLFSLGVILSTGNPISSKQEIFHQIQLSKPVIAFSTADVASKIPNLKTIVLNSPEFESLVTSSTPIGEELQGASNKVNQSDPAAILYSSGTTGRVKGVMLTHRNLTYMVAAGQAVRVERKSPAVSYCAVPFFHVYGLCYFLRALAMGETVVLMARFDMKIMLRAIEELRITHMALAPPVVVAMVKDPKLIQGYDLSSLQVVGCGGAPLRKSIIQQFRQRFPDVILGQAYGLTESTARVFGTLSLSESQVIGATGKLMPNCQAKIVDPKTGLPLPPGSPGELWIRGPSIMKGYVDDEEATAAALNTEGWLRTGDLCYIDNEGYLFFMDRIKELIKYKGYQVAPAELEHLLHSHPDIVEAAVIPYPDEESGQVPVAFVVRQNGSAIDESQIKNFIAPQVAPYKRIRRVIFIDSLPRNAGGKLLRKELVKLSLSNATSKL
ncbi:4-coumarate--CoA ligase-like 9 [Euphorbia lathyris]|uniref:4-coumarate--CoA ligase-like 9 n=1 Tax=Euphorbia lathyris TaxID=212925 RepID=UPI0033137841